MSSQPSLLALSEAFNAALQGNPLGKSALPAAAKELGFDATLKPVMNFGPPGRDQVAPPYGSNPVASPNTFVGPEMPPASEGMTPPPIPEVGGPPTSSIIGGFEEGGPPSSLIQGGPISQPNTQSSGGIEDKKPSFWSNPEVQQTLLTLGGGLLGAGVGKLTGLGGGNVAAGAIGYGLKDLQRMQTQRMEREQKAFEDAYEQAKNLPSEIYNRPELKELLDAQQALMKDLQDGKVNNTKNVSNFLLAKSKYSKELEDITIESKINDEIKVKDALAEAELAREGQQVERWQSILSDPMSTPQEKEYAEGKLFEFNQKREEFELRKQELQESRKFRQAGLANDQARLGLERERLNLARDNANKNFQIRGAGMEQRAGLAQAANYQRRWNQEWQARARESSADQATEQMLLTRAEEIKNLAGIGDVDGRGNILIGGKPVPLISILGQTPDFWDANGTPSQRGWMKILQLANEQIMQTPTEMGLSSLGGAYSGDTE